MYGLFCCLFVLQYFCFNGGNVALMAAIAFALVECLQEYVLRQGGGRTC